MRRVGHIIAWTFACAVLLVLAALLFTQTGVFRGLVRTRVVNAINKVVDAKFSIGELRGNLINHVEMRNVLLIRAQDTIAFIRKVDIGFNPLRLLDKHIAVDSFIVDSVTAVARQNRDSTWNIAGLFKKDTAVLKDTTKGTSPFPYAVSLDNFVLRNTSARVVALDTTIPGEFKNLVIECSVDYGKDKQKLDLKELQFETVDPAFRLQKLSLIAVRNGDSITVSNFVLETRENRIEGAGVYDPSNPREGSAQITSAPIRLSEFRRFLPDVRFPVSPQVSFDAHLVKDTLFATLGLHVTDQSTSFDVAAYPASKLLSSRTLDSVNYRVYGKLHNIDVAQWSGDTTFAYNLNGTFTLNGHGMTSERMVSSFAADLSDCRVLGRPVRTAVCDVDYDGGNIEGTMRIAGAFGDFNFDALTIDVLHTQKYRASFSTTKLDLSKLFNDTTLKSDLNLAVVAQGTHFDPNKANGSIRFTVEPSTMYGFRADTGFVQIQFAPDDYQVDTAFVSSPYGTVEMGGRLSSRTEGELRYVARLSDLSTLHDFFKEDTLRGAVILSGTATGNLDSLITRGEYNFHGLVYNQIKLDTGAGTFDISRIRNKLQGVSALGIDGLRYSEYKIDTAAAKITLADSAYGVAADFAYRDSLKGKIEVDIVKGNIPTLIFRKLDLSLYSQNWVGGSDSTIIRMQQGAYDIEHLYLTGGDGDQRISVDGRFTMTGAENLRLDIASLDVIAAARLFGYTYPVTGLLSAKVTLTGTAANPLIQGNIGLLDGKLNRFEFQSLTSDFGYDGRRLTMKGELVPVANANMTVEGFLPMHLSFTDTTSDLINRGQPMQLRVMVNRIPLTVLEAMGDQIETTGGWIGGDFTLAGSLDNPDMSGRADIHDGGFVIKEYGIKYDKFEMGLVFDNSKIKLDSMRISRGKGFMRATGEVDFSGGLMSGNVSTTDIDWHSEHFYLVRHSNFEIQLTGNAKLNGPTTSPKFSGDVTVNRSRIYIPLLSDEAKKGIRDIPRPPLLVQVTGNQYKADTGSAVSDSAVTGDNVMKSIDLYKNLRGSMKLTIPRNTWLTGPDMNIEIGGDLQLVKNSPELFEIFGPIRIVRGKYSLFGKRFEIKDGTLTFVGGEDIDPNIDMNADYTFRAADRSKRLLRVHATGKAFNPTLEFSLDGNDVPERDAIAYIVFGKSMADVTGPGGGGGSFQGTDFAKGVAANALASELARTLGKRFALDVIEINSGGSFQSATVTVGKYVTNDLFMSYQRGIGETQSNDITPAIVTLEYELTKNLSAQLIQGESETSGFDMIFKFDY